MAAMLASGSSVISCLKAAIEQGEDFRIADRADAATEPEYRHTNSQSMQCLPQLQADYSQADHGHGLRQILPIEYSVADDDAIAEDVERLCPARTRAGRDDDGPGNDTRMPTHV
jgi:hypothetical protein